MTFSISDVVPVIIGQNDQRCQSSDKYVRLTSLKRYSVRRLKRLRGIDYLNVRIVRHVDGYNSFFFLRPRVCRLTYMLIETTSFP